MVRRFFIFVIFYVFASSAYAAATATVDRTTLNEGESLRLVLEGGDGEPDLSPLEALFDVHGTSTSSQVSFINGSMSSTKQWIVTLSPKQTGRLIIPALSFGKEKTRPIELSIRKAGSSASLPSGNNVFIEVNATPEQPYVQSQVIYTVKLFHAAEIRDGALSQPKLDDVVIERLGDDKTYQTVLNGKRFQVTERRYALFPQSSGTTVIPPTVFSGQVIDVSGRYQGRGVDPFNRFFSQPTMRPIQLRSKPVELKVRARPGNVAGANWLPARKLVLTESWSQNLKEVRVGEPITRTIRIEAQGLTGAQLPKIAIAEHPAFKQYPDQPKVENADDGESLVGIREDKIAIVPNQEGMITLPEIRLEWWNTRKNRPEQAVIPARELTVMPVAASANAPVSTPDTRIDMSERDGLDVFEKEASINSSGFWMWLSLFCLAGWLFTGLFWWRSKKAENLQESGASKRLPLIANLVHEREAIKRACIANDAVKARQGLISWARAMWPEKKVSSLLELVAHMESDQMSTLVTDLDTAIYSGKAGNWDGQVFWEKCSPLLKSPSQLERVAPPLLPELYPQR